MEHVLNVKRPIMRIIAKEIMEAMKDMKNERAAEIFSLTIDILRKKKRNAL